MASRIVLACVLFCGLAVAGVNAGRSSKPKSVAELATKEADLSTVLKLVVDAGLAGALDEKFEGSVFLPTNAAFEKIKDVVPTLTPEQVKAILLYHVSGTNVRGRDFDKAKEIATLNGQNVKLTQGKIQKINDANILQTRKAGKAKVFIIDNVLLPK